MRSLGAEYPKAGDDGKAGAAASRGLTPRGERRLPPEGRGECEAHRRAERPTPAVRDRDRPTPPPSRAPRAETGAERPRAGKTARSHGRWEEWRTLRPPRRRATGRRHGAGGGDEDRQRRR